MILINLLPHREEKRQLRKRGFYIGLATAAVLGLLVVGIGYTILQRMIGAQQERNEFLQQEIARLDGQIKDIANLRTEIEALKARQKAVEDLQSDRNLPVYLLDELAKQTPEGVYLTAVRQAGQIISVSGVAQTNERVSELLRNTQHNSAWLEKPELVEIKAITAAGPNREQRRLFDFAMRVSLKRPQTPAAAAASAPAAGASAAAASKSS